MENCQNIFITQKWKSQKDDKYLCQKVTYNFWPRKKRGKEGEKAEGATDQFWGLPQPPPFPSREWLLIASQTFVSSSVSPQLHRDAGNSKASIQQIITEIYMGATELDTRESNMCNTWSPPSKFVISWQK